MRVNYGSVFLSLGRQIKYYIFVDNDGLSSIPVFPVCKDFRQ